MASPDGRVFTAVVDFDWYSPGDHRDRVVDPPATTTGTARTPSP
jgi:hypothetical protein